MYNSAFKQSYILLHLLFMTYQNPSALYSEKKEKNNPCRSIETSKTCQRKMTLKMWIKRRNFPYYFMWHILFKMFLKMEFNKVKSFKNTLDTFYYILFSIKNFLFSIKNSLVLKISCCNFTRYGQWSVAILHTVLISDDRIFNVLIFFFFLIVGRDVKTKMAAISKKKK